MGTPVMKTNQPRNDQYRANLLLLTEACPVAECDCNPEDCPLCLVRKMNSTQRLEWFEGLSENDLAYLATYHYICLNKNPASNEAGKRG